MPVGKRTKASAASPARNDPAIEKMIDAFDEPLRGQIRAVRRIILDASPEIGEGVKWNAPSFRTTEFFATIDNRRVKDRVRIILHRGAKVRGDAPDLSIPDPEGLLTFLAPDRCLITFADAADVAAKAEALRSIIRAWIRHV